MGLLVRDSSTPLRCVQNRIWYEGVCGSRAAPTGGVREEWMNVEWRLVNSFGNEGQAG